MVGGHSMDLVTLLLFVAGFGLLIVGAEALVRGASRLACTLGVSPLIVGLTIVALGTSSPELAVGIQSSLMGGGDIALGNVVGSNIVNVLFILGLSAMITPLVVAQQLVRLDVPLMIGVSALLLLLGLDGSIGQLDGILLLAGIVAYTVFAIRQSRRESRQVKEEYAREFGKKACRNLWQVLAQIALVVGGLALLVIGSRWLVEGAVALALALGLSELIVGLTVVAAGTGMPEVVTCVTASIRGERDIAVGNVVGSNIYNILAVLGLTAVVAPGGVTVPPAALAFDMPVMIAVAAACLPVFFLDGVIARWEGALFFGYYLAYTLYLVLDATQHDALSTFSMIMLAFVIPLTVITLAVLVVRALRGNRTGPII
jgi:cation:H+ antiporter